MKKKIVVFLIAICSTFLTAGLASCDTNKWRPEEVIGSVQGQEFALDLSGFDSVVGYRSEIAYDTIKINHYHVSDGNVFHEKSVTVEKDMLVSGGATDTIGEHELVISYEGEEFSVPYTVKYQVDFIAEGEICETQYVLTPQEIVLPQAPVIADREFGYWEMDIPTSLTDNLSIEGYYYVIPTLEKIEQVYDSNATISSLALPSNDNGAWVLAQDGNTPIGGVGEKSFAVRFIPAIDGLKEREGNITVNVLPKEVTFTVENTSFVYDGEAHFPVCVPSEEAIFEVVGKSKTNVGEYTFELLVTDPNYFGVYFGSYSIVKADVTVTVQDKTMKYGETVPEVEYTVNGFANTEVLGIQTQKPRVNGIGEYTLEAVVSNANVNATVINGTLTVNKGDLIVDDPILSTDNANTPAIYESPLSSIDITGDYRGEWTWKEPTAIINSVDSYTAIAVFTPNNNNFNVIEREITITNLDKRTLELTVISSEYTYTGEAYTIVYEIAEGKILRVDGVLTKTEAGVYPTTLSINNKYYKGEVKVNLVIHKATPATDFSTDYTKTWENFLSLSDIELSEGYTWDAPETSLKDRIGTYEYPATFTHADPKNYETVSGTFTVTVEKAEGILHGVKDSYTFTYNKDSAQTLTGITSTPADGTIEYTYLLNGEEVDEMKGAGTYQVTIDLLESAYHTSTTKTTEVIINKVVNTDVVTLEQSAIYGDLMSSLALPTNEFGVWKWEGATNGATVGNAGEHTYVAVYTPDDTANYESRRVEVSVTVAKQTVYEPTIQNKVYVGSEITFLTVGEDDLYTAEGDLKATDAGEYAITLTLKDSANYKWSGSSAATIEIEYDITQAPNAITSLSMESWTYNDEEKTPVIKANFGVNTVVYYYAPFGTQAYVTEVPTTAGTYNLKAVIAETANYAKAEKIVTSAFTIAKDTPVVVFDKQYTKTWYEGLKLSAIALEEGFSWKEDATLEVGAEQVFAVVYTPQDTTNYNTVEGTFKVTVEKRLVTLNGVAESYARVYNGVAFEISGVTSTPNVQLVYTYSGGEAPVNAGEYTVTITLQDTAHYTLGNASESVVRTIVIDKADVDTVVSFNAVYEDKLGGLILPTSEVGVWTWKEGNDALVGNVGTRSHVAVFTSTSDNYNSLERAFIVTVAKKEISKPTILENSFVYTGSAHTVLGDTDLYTVSGNTKTDVGEYTVTVTLKDSANYAWTATSVDPTFEITQATTEIKNLAITGWTYGEEANAPTATTNFGTIKYWYAGEDGVYTENVPENAGNYTVKASVAGNNNYTSDETDPVSFIIAKAVYTQTLLTESYSINWFDGITLAAVNNLPTGYAWTDGSVLLTAGTTAKFGVTYVDPSENYEPAYGEFTVTVNKLVSTLTISTAFNGATTSVYTHTYNGGAFVLTAGASHTEKTPVYTVNGVKVDEISLTEAGEYEISVTLEESAHYLATSWTKTIIIEKATVTYVLPTWNPSVDATMGDLALPAVNETLNGGYEWIWQDMNGIAVDLTQKVGEPAETVTYKLAFVSNDPNYKSFTETHILTVGKIIVSPTLAVNSFEYDNKTFTVSVLGVPAEVGYTVNYVTDFKNVGAHKVELIMEAGAYATHAWNGSTTDTISLPVTITASVNTVESVAIVGWTYGGETNAPQTTTKFGGDVVYTHYDVNTPDDIKQGIPSDAGTYVLIATSANTDNYTSDSKASEQFTIAQATPEVTFETTYTLDWFNGITLGAVELASAECEWVDATLALEVGENQKFTAVYTPTNTNYKAIDVEITVTVEKATANINGVAENYTHTYDSNAYTIGGITASHEEATLEYTYTLNGEEVDEIKGAGVYQVTITLAETAHYNQAMETTVVTVEQAENEWNAIPEMSLESWVFDTEAGVASATSKFGEVIVEYKLQSEEDSAYAEGQPTAAGAYFVRFRVEGTDDFEGVISEAIPFTIEQATVEASLVAGNESFVYNDVEYTANVQLSVEDVSYTVADNKETEVGDYTLIVTLTNSNYKFANGTNQTTLPFSITKAAVTLSVVTVADGKYGEYAPTASATRTDSGTYDITIKYYYDTERDGEYANEWNLDETFSATTYYVKAVVEGNKNYFGAETEPVAVKILQADTDEALVETEYEQEWQEGLFLSTIIPTGTGIGTYVWVVENGTAETTALIVQEYTSFKVKFTPQDKNYAEITLPVTVNVTPMKVETPTSAKLTDGETIISTNPTYNNKAWTAAESETDDCTISATSATNANETITVTFTLKANRAWKDGSTGAKTLTYTVQKAPNEITSFNYNATTGVMTINATYYTEELVTYYYRNSNDTNGDFVATLPEQPGTYDVKVVIAASDNYTGAERTFTEAVSLSQTSVTPTITTSSNVYTGEDITATVTLTPNVSVTIACDNGGVVSGNTITVVNAGTYTVTLTLSESSLSLYKWADKDANVASTTVTFTISGESNGWAEDAGRDKVFAGLTYDTTANLYTRDYDSTESIVDETVQWTKYGTATIIYKKVVNGVETQLEEGVYPKDAGNYKIYFVVEGEGNYDDWSDEVYLTINRIKIEISTLPTHTQDQYQDQFLSDNSALNGWGKTKDPVVTLGGVEASNEEAEDVGKFVYGDITINNNADGVTATYTLTFMPHTENYTVSEAEVTITLKKVAHVANTTEVKTGNTVTGGTLVSQIYYGTIEDALAAANKASTKVEVWVIPDKTKNVKICDTGVDGNKDNVVYVGKNVTLILPFAVGTNDYVSAWNSANSGRNPDGKDYTSAGQEHTLATQSNHLKSEVILVSGVTLQVQGVMEIAGRLGGGESSKFFAGHTFGNYAQLTLEDGANVQIDGKLSLTGYIVGDNGQVTVNNGGKLYQPFILNDHAGGNHMKNVTVGGKAAPFNRYQFRNIEKTLLRVNYGGEMYVYANMFADTSPAEDGSYNHAEALFIGKGAVIELTAADSYMTSVFTPSKTREQNDHYPYTLFHNDKTVIHIYGGAKMNQLSMTLLGATIESKNFDFPIPCFYDITLHDGNYSMANRVKLMPGAKLTVEEGAALTATTLSVYDMAVHVDLVDFGDHDFYDSVSAKIPATFTVNGSFTANTFGGTIHTNKLGATVAITTATNSVQEMLGQNWLKQPTYTEYKHTLSLKKAGNMGGNFTAAGTYYSDGTGWYTTKYSISYDFNGGNTVGNGTISGTNGINGYTVKAADLPTSTRAHYTFSHWCLTDGCTDEACEGVQVGDILYGDTILYAAWTANEYTMQFVNVLPDGTQSETGVANVTFTVESTFDLPAMPTAPNASYNFSGWFNANGTQIVAILGSDFANEALTNNGTATVYAYWTSDVVYEVIFQTNNSDFANSSTQATNALTLPDLTGKNNVVTYTKYFAGWFVDSALTTAYTDWEQLKAYAATGGVETQRTLYAKWANKIAITVTSDDDKDDSDGTYDAVYTIAFSETANNSDKYGPTETFTKTNGTWYIVPGHYVYLNATASSSITGISNNTWTKADAAMTIKVNYDNTGKTSSSCFTGDTLITLADGTQKRADQVTMEDSLLVFNHETGKYEAAGIIFIENDGFAEYNVINLTFSDGTTTKLIYEHGYFNLTLNKYVYITEDNYAEFIGHEFAVKSGDSYTAITLTNAFVAKEYTSCYSLVTVYHLNYFVDGLFSMPGGIEGLFNMFEYGEGLVYDQEKMHSDIEKYGLFTYEDFAEYLPYEVYAAFPAPQLKVSIGKGMVSFEEILGYIEKYLVKNEVI